MVAMLRALPEHPLPEQCTKAIMAIHREVEESGASVEIMNISVPHVREGVLAHGMPTTAQNATVDVIDVLKTSDTFPKWNELRAAHLVFSQTPVDNLDGKVRVYKKDTEMQNGQDGSMIYFSNKIGENVKGPDETSIGIQWYANNDVRFFTGISDIRLVPKLFYLVKLVMQCLADSVKVPGETISFRVTRFIPFLVKLVYAVPPAYKSFDVMGCDAVNAQFSHGIGIYGPRVDEAKLDFSVSMCDFPMTSYKVNILKHSVGDKPGKKRKNENNDANAKTGIKCILSISHGKNAGAFDEIPQIIFNLSAIRKTLYELIRSDEEGQPEAEADDAAASGSGSGDAKRIRV
jgi:hypothetical protein